MDEELKPTITNNEDDFSKELVPETREEDVDVSTFIEGFPDWDLLPPNNVVRRITRK